MPTFDYNRVADMLHSVRTTLDKYQPSVGTAMGLTAGPTGWLTAIPGPKSLILDNFKNMKGPTDPAAASPAPAAPPGMQPQSPVPFQGMGGLPPAMSPQAAPTGPSAPMPQPRPAAATPGAPLDITSPAQAASMAAPAAAPQAAPMGFQWAQAGGNQHQGLIDRVINTFHHLQQGNTGPAQGQPQAPMMQASAAPQGGDTGPGFFQRNAMMMRDPSTGQTIDPTGAAQAGVRGPDLINKMMGYLNNKPFGDTGSNNG